MSDITHNENYIGDARSRLLEQFKSKPRIDGLLVAFMAEAQELEDAMWAVFIGRLMDQVPTGDILDKIGAIVGQERRGADDDQYRIFITARIATNRSEGRHETLIRILLLLVNQQVPIGFRTYLKALEMEADDVPADPYIIWHDFLNVAKAAGDNLRFFFSMQPVENILRRTSVSGGVTTVTTQRKGSVTGVYGGGVFAGVFGGF